jgi:hypothetical protein
MRKPVFLIVLVVILQLGASMARASAASENGTFVFAAGTASAYVSDCPPEAAAGTHCTLLVMFAFDTHISGSVGHAGSDSFVVAVDDIVFTGPGAWQSIPRGIEVITTAQVTITGGLRRAFARAEDVHVAGMTLDIDITWVATGEPTRTTRRQTFAEDGFTVRFSDDTRHADADATAIVNGETFTDFAGGSFLDSNRDVTVCIEHAPTAGAVSPSCQPPPPV